MQNSMNQQNMNNYQNGIKDIASLSGSDERIKKNVERLDVEAIPGVPFATFQYKHDPSQTHLGVIAQDLEKVRPDLVHTGPEGIKRVDYSGLTPFLKPPGGAHGPK